MQSGKPNFGYIYGVGLFGSASMYTLLNLMSERGIDAYRVVSVLGYCLLPMVGVSAISVMMVLEYVLPLLSREIPNLTDTVAAHSDIYCQYFQFFGAPTQHQEYLLLFFKCLINGCLLLTLLDCCTVALPFLVCLMGRRAENYLSGLFYTPGPTTRRIYR
jgi:hypothetical protein